MHSRYGHVRGSVNYREYLCLSMGALNALISRWFVRSKSLSTRYIQTSYDTELRRNVSIIISTNYYTIIYKRLSFRKI